MDNQKKEKPSKIVKKINLIEFIVKLGHQPNILSNSKKTGKPQAYFCSPLRGENNPSFSVGLTDTDEWIYYDATTEETGYIIDFVMQYYSIKDVKEAIKKIFEIWGHDGNFNNNNILIKPKQANKKENNIELTKVKNLENKAMIEYLQGRKINIDIAKKYLKEIYYKITFKDKNNNDKLTEKKYFGLAFENVAGGFEIRNKYFKGNCNGKDISFFKGEDSTKVIIFEGFSSFLSALTYYKKDTLKYDVIVLNTVSLITRAINLIIRNNYNTVFDYLDNDFGGQGAICKLKDNIKNINVIKSHNIYKGFNDFNDFLLYENADF